jgi:hypothetical protein
MLKKLIHNFTYTICLLPFVLFLIKIVHNLLFYFSIVSSLEFAAIISVIIIFLIIFTTKLIKVNILRFQINSLQSKYLWMILLFGLINSIIFLDQFTTEEIAFPSGDGIRHIKIIYDILNIKQSFRSYNFLANGEVVLGNYYPLQSHYLPALISYLPFFSIIDSYVISTVFIAFFMFPLYLFLLLSYFASQNIAFYLTLASSLVSIQFIGLIFTSNFAQYYANTILFLLIFIFFVTKNSSLRSLVLACSLLLSTFMLFSSHPSTLFSYLLIILILTFRLRFMNSLIFAGFFFSFLIIFLSLLKYFSSELLAFLDSQPPVNQNFDLQINVIISKIIEFIQLNLIYLSNFELKFPFGLFFILLFFSLNYFNKKFNEIEWRFLILFIISSIIVLSSSTGGLADGLGVLSILSFFYYSSPVRISHLVFLILFISLAFMLDKIRVNFSLIGSIINKTLFQLIILLGLAFIFYYNLSFFSEVFRNFQILK